MSRSFDYSKWDRLEVSDDEKDAHPNIDSSLMIRIKREQRARREAEEAMKKAELRKIGTPDAMKQIQEIDRRSKLHVDNICRVVDEKTIINKPEKVSSSPASNDSTAPKVEARPDMTEEEEFEEYVEKNAPALSEYSQTEKLEDSEAFLIEHTDLISDHACGWLLLQMLSLEMDGCREEMIHCTRQYLMLRNILDLAVEAKRGNDARQMIKLFFKQILGDKDRQALLDRETGNFAQQIIARAIQKRAEDKATE